MRTRAFRALVPAPGRVTEVATVPYDVVNAEEARALVTERPYDLLHVDRAEIDLPPETDPYSEAVYARARENFLRFQADGALVREDEPTAHIYCLTMGGHRQTGVVLACHIGDYESDVIRKHEKTRPVKEDDRTRLVEALSAHTGPIFLTYPDQRAIDAVVEDVTAGEPGVDFEDDSGVRHQVWTAGKAEALVKAFEDVPVAYVADGHHRIASAQRVAAGRRSADPQGAGERDSDWFLGVLFPASQVKILPYNRVVRDLNGKSSEDFLAAVSAQPCPHVETGWPEPGRVRVYVAGDWHEFALPAPDGGDPESRLDVAVLQERIFGAILGVGDPRTDERVDFVGGIRGMAELERRVDSGEWAAGFALHPVTVNDLIQISDAGRIMPPKSTWFEPKLRSGLFIYTF